MRLRYYIFIIQFLLLFFISSCINLNHQLNKEENKNVKVLYKQSIEGNKNLQTYKLEEFYRQKPNRKLVFQQITPYWGIYTFGKIWYSPKRVEKKKLKVIKRYKGSIEIIRTNQKIKKAILDSVQKEVRVTNRTELKVLEKQLRNDQKSLKHSEDSLHQIIKKYNSSKILKKHQGKIGIVRQRIFSQENIIDSIIKLRRKKNTQKLTKTYKKESKKLNKLKDKEAKFIQSFNKKIEKKELTIKEGNWLMRVVGEPLSVFDSVKHESTRKNMNLYLKSQGYYDSKVDTIMKINNKKVDITYMINEGKVHTIDTVLYDTIDTKIHQIILNPNRENILRKKTQKDSPIPLRLDDLSIERNAIYNELRNQGYFKFQRQYISFQIDTLDNPYKAKINVAISQPPHGKHKQYYIRNVYVLMDVKKQQNIDTTIYIDKNTQKRLFFIHKKEELKVPQKNIFNIILLQQGDLYSLEKTRQTQQYLADVDIFKFININYKELEDSTNQLDAYINTNSFKKYQLTTEAGVNVNVDAGQGLPGPFFNIKFKDRKVFHGLEVFESNVRYSLEGQLDPANPDTILTSQVIGANISLVSPRLFFPTFMLNKDRKLQLHKTFPKTRLTIGYSENNNTNYHRTLFNMTGNYLFKMSQTNRLSINAIDINFLRTRNISSFFEDFLNTLETGGQTLSQSFRSGIVTSTQIRYTINNNDLTKNTKAKFYRFLGEIGYSLYKNGAIVVPAIDTSYTYPHYQYFKLNADLRHYYPISKNGTFALRLNAGFIKTYGATTILPFEKYFFIGGINSIRAWGVRALGPGGYIQDGETTLLQQPGDIILESSLELRSKLSGIFNGAFFIDAGNIWTFEKEETRENTQFDVQNFYRTVAIGSGVGLRIDFSFLIIRFDLGVKVWDPAYQRWKIKDYKEKNTYAINFGIGYPF